MKLIHGAKGVDDALSATSRNSGGAGKNQRDKDLRMAGTSTLRSVKFRMNVADSFKALKARFVLTADIDACGVGGSSELRRNLERTWRMPKRNCPNEANLPRARKLTSAKSRNTSTASASLAGALERPDPH